MSEQKEMLNLTKHRYVVNGIACVGDYNFIGECISDDIIKAIILFREHKDKLSVHSIQREEVVLNSIRIFREVTSGRRNSRLHILNFCSIVASPAELSISTALIGVPAAEMVGSCVSMVCKEPQPLCDLSIMKSLPSDATTRILKIDFRWKLMSL